MKDTITFRYRMSDRDVFYGGGVVNGARSITLMEDAAKRLMAKTFGNTGRCVEVKKVRLYTPIRKQEGNKVLIEVRSFKIIEVPADPPYPSSIDVLEDPPLSTVVQFWYEY